MRSLTRLTQRALAEFDAAARTLGWEQDHGTGARFMAAERDYTITKARLTRRLLYLERRITQLSTYNGER